MSNAISNIPGQVLGMYQAGQQNRDRTTRRNALAQYATAATPEAQGNALRPLVGMGDFETANAARTYGEQQRFDQTRRDIAPALGSGRFGDAAQSAAGAGQVDLAAQLMTLDRASLTNTKQRGEMAGAAILAGVRLPDPERRRAYFMSPRIVEMAQQAGIDPETLANADYSDTDHMRALASSFLDLSRMAGDVSLQRFGDNVETVRTDPLGSEVLDSRAVPMTRAEQFDRQQFGYRQQQDGVDNQYRQGRAEAEDAYRAWQMQSAPSRSEIEGQVLQKAVTNGAESLTPEERQVYDRAVSTQQNSFGFGGYGAPQQPPQQTVQPSPAPPQSMNQPQPPSRPRMQSPSTPPGAVASNAGGSAGSPARPADQAAFDRLPVGAWFVNPADGRVMQKAQ